MKKTTKGAIAVGAATLLLLGGGGTFALWNNSATVDAGTIESGHLTIDTASTTNQWYDTTGFNAAYAAWLADPRSDDQDPDHATWLTEEPVLISAAFEIPDIANWPVAPGAELAFVSSDIALGAEGVNLKFTVDAELLDSNDDPIVSGAQGFEFTVGDVEFSSMSPVGGLVEDTGVWSIAPAAQAGAVTADATIQVDVVFPDTIEDQDFFDEDVNLSKLSIKLQQVV